MTNPHAEQGYTVPVKCAVCSFCWLNPRTGRCAYHGPYSGYEVVRPLAASTAHPAPCLTAPGPEEGAKL